MKIQKANIKRPRGLNAKDLVKKATPSINGVEGHSRNRKKACIPPISTTPKKRKTKEDRVKEDRETKRDAFLLFLQGEENKN